MKFQFTRSAAAVTVYRGLPDHVIVELLFSDDAQAVTLTQMRPNVNTAISEPGVQNLTLPDGQGRLVKFSLRLPVEPCTGRIPLLIVLAGIKTNESTLERAPAQAVSIRSIRVSGRNGFSMKSAAPKRSERTAVAISP